MITYPSTHGVFEEAFVDICRIIHDCGGQVYLDGANLNALVGLSQPGLIGADVAHINLHKTFCIPHGGGGPGAGPIGVRAHLAPYLPDHPVVGGVNPAAGPAGTIGPIAGAPWGSASLMTISWAYIAMMGAEGLTRATQIAILNANYIARRLSAYYPILYTGKNNLVAHECIIDLRPIKEATGITVDDIAKRLVDYGFHAPTMSFPVPDTLMIEPTESESKRELDRFCEAMIGIREEIAAVERGEADPENNVLRNAPHPPGLLLEEPWRYPYTKQQAFYPLASLRDDKFWPPVGRIDNVRGDRQLICTCPPLSAYAGARRSHGNCRAQQDRLTSAGSERRNTKSFTEYATMPVILVLTATSPDKPGLIDLLSTTLATHGANWQHSRMATLGGQFAGLLQASVPEKKLAALESALEGLRGEGLTVTIAADPARPAVPGLRRVKL